MPRSQLDHIVLTTPTLALGIDSVRRALGVTPQVGGEHPRMGTHNYFLKLGERVYLEIISVNPNAHSPRRPRWFALDHIGPDALPRLATWVARTDDIEAAAAASPVNLGSVEPMTRGQLHWHITIPEDGSLPCEGIAPTLIQWPPGTHPTTALEDLGCTHWNVSSAFTQILKWSQRSWRRSGLSARLFSSLSSLAHGLI